MPVALRLGRVRTQCDPLLLVEALPKIHTVGFSIPRAQNTYGGATSLPYLTTPLTLRSPKPYFGQLNPKGPTWGVLFAPPIFGPWASDPKSKKMAVCNFGKPHFSPLVATCYFLQFWSPEHQRTTLTPTDTQPIARKSTYLGANLN